LNELQTNNGFAVICGAGPNLGRALAREYASQGLDVFVTSRDLARAEALAGELNRELGSDPGVGAVTGIEADVSGPGVTDEARRLVLQRGVPDVVVFNAVAFVPGAPSATTPESLLEQLNVSAGGLLRVAHAFLPQMAARGRGSFLVTGGGTAARPWLAATGLGVQKAALANLAAAFAGEYRPQGVNVALVTVPGTIAEGSAFAPASVAAAFRRIGDDPTSPVETVLTKG
jgi:short-subunit dehydrogenase